MWAWKLRGKNMQKKLYDLLETNFIIFTFYSTILWLWAAQQNEHPFLGGDFFTEMSSGALRTVINRCFQEFIREDCLIFIFLHSLLFNLCMDRQTSNRFFIKGMWYWPQRSVCVMKLNRIESYTIEFSILYS